jgi:hypothetical protein
MMMQRRTDVRLFQPISAIDAIKDGREEHILRTADYAYFIVRFIRRI